MASRLRHLWHNYRWKELFLLLVPFAILVVGRLQISLAPQDSPTSFDIKNLPAWQDFLPILGLIVLLLLVNVIFSAYYPKADQVLLPTVGLLSGIGVLMAARLGPHLPFPDPSLGTRQFTWVSLGLLVCGITLFGLRDMKWLKNYKYTWAIIGIFLVGITLVNAFVRVRNFDSPTHDQLNFGPLSLQPSELLKIFIVIFFAAFISENQDMFVRGTEAQGRIRLGPLYLPPARVLAPIILMLLTALALFFGIRELGLALLIYGIFLSMVYLGSGKISYVVFSFLIFLVLGFIGYILLSYVQKRFAVLGFDVLNWQNWSRSDTKFAENDGLQVIQGIIALSSGGIFGAGLGLGHPTVVPVVQSDMIFTALGEELGMAGLFAITSLYLFIIYRGYRIATEAIRPFDQLLAAGLTSIFAIQTLIIALGNMKLLPLTGIPLPFLSYGGSSILANYIVIGILLRISHNTALERAASMGITRV